MRVVTYQQYGTPDVFRLEERPVPSPEPGQVRIRIHATEVSSTDATFRRGDFFARLAMGLFAPKHPVLGTEVAGVVDAVGEGVTRFAVGDEVVAASGTDFGGYAEYIVLPEDGAIGPKPANISFAEAAAVAAGALTALPFLRDGAELKPGQKVLINGASGAVGLAAVQLAKHLGAHVTGVSSARNHDLLRDLGADDVVDYTTTDLATLEPVYDVVFDAVGKTSFGVARRLLKPGGRYLTTVPSLRILWQSVWTRVAGRRSASILFAGLRTPADQSEYLLLLRNLVEQGKLRAVIDRTFEMREIALAHRLVESGHKRGHAVLQVA